MHRVAHGKQIIHDTAWTLPSFDSADHCLRHGSGALLRSCCARNRAQDIVGASNLGGTRARLCILNTKPAASQFRQGRDRQPSPFARSTQISPPAATRQPAKRRGLWNASTDSKPSQQRVGATHYVKTVGRDLLGSLPANSTQCERELRPCRHPSAAPRSFFCLSRLRAEHQILRETAFAWGCAAVASTSCKNYLALLASTSRQPCFVCKFPL